MAFFLIYRLATNSKRLGHLSNQLYRCHPFSSVIMDHTSNHCNMEKLRNITPLGFRSYLVQQQISSVRFFAAPAMAKKEHGNEKKVTRLNAEITAHTVRLVSDEGHEIVTRREALQRAKLLNLDLVEVDSKANPPVCKILDYHKEKYEKDVRDKKLAKAKAETGIRKGDCKEVHFTGKIEQKDLQMKADTVKRLMERGYRVKVVANAGNNNETSDAEREDLKRVLSRLYNLVEDISTVESSPRVEKRKAYLIVRHVKFGTKKNPTKKTSKIFDDWEDDVQVEVEPPVVGGSSKQSVMIDSTKETVMANYNISSASEVNSGSNQRHQNYSPTVGAMKTRSDSKNDMKNRVESNDPISVPSPALSNRYKRSDASSGRNAGRVLSQPSFNRSRNHGQLGTQLRQSIPDDSNYRGKIPSQTQPDDVQKHGESRLEHHNFIRHGSTTAPPSNFGSRGGSKFTPFNEEKNQMARNMEEKKSTSENSLNIPNLKGENARHGHRTERDYGLFSRTHVS